MHKRSILLVLIFALALLVPAVSASVGTQSPVPPGTEYTYTVATIGGPRSLDPAWAYDTAGCSIIMQVYETLIDFKGSSTTQFISELAESWTISPDGLTYTFKIRATPAEYDIVSTVLPGALQIIVELSDYDPYPPPPIALHPGDKIRVWDSYQWYNLGVPHFEDHHVLDVVGAGPTWIIILREPITSSIPYDPALDASIFKLAGITPVFCDGKPLETEDVQYSIKRHMVRDRSGGPMWMHYEPLLGMYSSRNWPGLPAPAAVAALGHAIDNAITWDAQYVTFHLVMPYAPYMQVLAQTCSSIMHSEWMERLYRFPGGAIDSFDFPGWEPDGVAFDAWWPYNNYQREALPTYFNFKLSPLDWYPPQMMGTGPFIFVEWVKGEGGWRTLRRKKDYWGGWPAASQLTGTYHGYDRNHDGFVDDPSEHFNPADPVDSLWVIPALTYASVFRIFNWLDMNGDGVFDAGDLEYWGRTYEESTFWPVFSISGSGLAWTLVNKSARYGDFAPSRGWIDTYIEYQISDWATRRLGLLASTFDVVYVPRANIAQVWQAPGIRCKYPQETLSVDALFFNFNIADGMTGISPYVGNEQWGTGLPLNAFSDINMRKGFLYSFDFALYVSTQWLDEAFQVASPIIPGLAPYAPPPPPYPANYLKNWHIANRPGINWPLATAYFSMAWGGIDANGDGDALDPGDTPGAVWQNGFFFEYVYNIGNELRRIEGEMLRDTLRNQINPRFIMNVVGVDWAIMLDEIYYEPTNYRSILPLFGCGWQADFADAHNFVTAFMYTYGYFSYAQSYSNPIVDTLIDQGIAETDPLLRILIYDQLNNLFIQDQPDIMKVQPLGRRWEKDYVQGWYYNPLSMGSAANYIGEQVCSNLYTIWKEDLRWEDIDANGKIEIKDIAYAAKAFGGYFIQRNLPPATDPPGPNGYYTANWDSRCDIDQNKKNEVKDLAKIAIRFGYVAAPWIPPPDP